MLTHPTAASDEIVTKVTRATRYEDLPELLTAKEVAALLDISPRTVYLSIRSNKIPSVKVGDKLLYVPRAYFISLIKKAS